MTEATLDSCRARCPQHGTLLSLRDGKCVAYDHYPAANQEVSMLTAVEPQPLVEPETGEIFSQPTLDDAMFPAVKREAVPMVKVSFSGTVEMTEAEFAAYCDEGLEPGRIVKVTLSGYLPNPHGKWVKRKEKVSPRFNETSGDFEGNGWHTWWELEGAVKVKALELGRFELGGMYDGEE